MRSKLHYTYINSLKILSILLIAFMTIVESFAQAVSVEAASVKVETVRVGDPIIPNLKKVYEAFSQRSTNIYTTAKLDWTKIYKIDSKGSIFYEIAVDNFNFSELQQNGKIAKNQDFKSDIKLNNLRAVIQKDPKNGSYTTLFYLLFKAEKELDWSKYNYVNYKDYSGTVTYITYNNQYADQLTFKDGKLISRPNMPAGSQVAGSRNNATKVVYPEPKHVDTSEINKVKSAYLSAIKNTSNLYTKVLPEWNKATKVTYEGSVVYEIPVDGSIPMMVHFQREGTKMASQEELMKINDNSRLRILMFFDSSSNTFKSFNYVTIYSESNVLFDGYKYPAYKDLSGNVMRLDINGSLLKIFNYNKGVLSSSLTTHGAASAPFRRVIN